MNLKQRYEINLRCGSYLPADEQPSPEHLQMREAARQLIDKDPVFFINAFCWTYDPTRYRGRAQNIPLLLFPIQDYAVKEVDRAICRGTAVGLVKSREVGATWIILACIVRHWLTQPDFNFRISSHGEKHVYKVDDKDTLFWKAQYLVDKLPAWLRPAGWKPTRDVSFMMMKNPANGSTLTGSAPTASFVVSGRTSGLFFDEFPLWQEASEVWGKSVETSPCRIVAGTPEGAGNQYATLLAAKQPLIKRIDIDWRDDPRKNNWVAFARKPSVEEVMTIPDNIEDENAAERAKFSPEEMLRPSFLATVPATSSGEGWARGTMGQNCPVDNIPSRVNLQRVEGYVYYPWYDYKKWREFNGDEARIASQIDRSFTRSVRNVVLPQFAFVKRGRYPRDHRLPLYTAWDAGLDMTCIIWIQTNPITQQIQMIDYVEASDQLISWFAPFVTGEVPSSPFLLYSQDQIEMIKRHQGWEYRAHYIDPSTDQRSAVSRITVQMELASFDIHLTSNELTRSFEFRTRTAAKLLCRTCIDEVFCDRLITNFENYKYPERPEGSQTTQGVTKGVHNKFCHGPNAYMYFAGTYQADYVDPDDFREDTDGTIRNFREIMAVNNGGLYGPSGKTGYGF